MGNNISELIRVNFEKIKANPFLVSEDQNVRKRSNWLFYWYIYYFRKINVYLRHKVNILPKVVTIKTFWGEKMKMICPRPTSLYFFGFIGNDELYVTDFLIRNLKKGDVFIDGGANLGFFSLLASHFVENHGSVYSFEPSQGIYDLLLQNVSNYKNIITYNKALVDSAGQVRFTEFTLDNNFYSTVTSSKNLLIEKFTDLQKDSTAKEYTIEGVTLDDFCKSNKIMPSIIKLDTESTEYQILLGSVEIMERYELIFIVEILYFAISDGTFDKIFELLASKKYQCYQLISGFEKKEILSKQDILSNYYNFVFTNTNVK